MGGGPWPLHLFVKTIELFFKSFDMIVIFLLAPPLSNLRRSPWVESFNSSYIIRLSPKNDYDLVGHCTKFCIHQKN